MDFLGVFSLFSQLYISAVSMFPLSFEFRTTSHDNMANIICLNATGNVTMIYLAFDFTFDPFSLTLLNG